MFLLEKELDYMIERFPQFRARVIELYASNDDFRSLCEDYWQCDYNVRKLAVNLISEERLANNYKMLSLSLEQEVWHFLSRSL